MSKRQKEVHAQKEEGKRRWYPNLNHLELQYRLEMVHAVVHFIEEELNNGLSNGRVPEEQQRMFGAHFTIGIYTMNRLMDIYSRELELAKKEADLSLATVPLLTDPKGNPIA